GGAGGWGGGDGAGDGAGPGTGGGGAPPAPAPVPAPVPVPPIPTAAEAVRAHVPPLPIDPLAPAEVDKILADACDPAYDDTPSPPPTQVSHRVDTYAGTGTEVEAPFRIVLRAGAFAGASGSACSCGVCFVDDKLRDNYDVDGDGEADPPGGQEQETKAKEVLNVFDGAKGSTRKRTGYEHAYVTMHHVHLDAFDEVKAEALSHVALRGSIGTGLELDQEGSDTDNSSDGSTTDHRYQYFRCYGRRRLRLLRLRLRRRRE
uniref:hypothetical protein n=1 Tax=Candidatus Symbiothrix dinenymphae TaxID=467085 RepID=UPI000B085E5F